jgi:hypothetical protein
VGAAIVGVDAGGGTDGAAGGAPVESEAEVNGFVETGVTGVVTS